MPRIQIERETMSRRHEPVRDKLPPPDPRRAELGQSKALEDREESGPPAEDYVMLPDGTAAPIKTAGDAAPANDAKW